MKFRPPSRAIRIREVGDIRDKLLAQAAMAEAGGDRLNVGAMSRNERYRALFAEQEPGA